MPDRRWRTTSGARVLRPHRSGRAGPVGGRAHCHASDEVSTSDIAEQGGRWFEQAPPSLKARENQDRPNVEQLWERCPNCRAVLYKEDLAETARVCPQCGQHLRIGAWERLELLVDPGSFRRMDAGLAPRDPLEFVDSKPYAKRISASAAKTGESDAWIGGTATVDGVPVHIGT